MTVIEVTDLTKRYGDRTVVDGVSFTVAEGEIFGILGRNGAGKTTTVECVSGLRRPDGGTVRVLGLDPHRDADRDGLRRVLGVQLQEAALPERLRVVEALDLFASFYPNPADPRALLAELGLEQVRDTAYGKLSGGQKQRLSIALALVGSPRIAILDELTTGLDPQARRDTWALIEQVRARGVTIVLVTHFMDEARRLCDRIAVIHEGRVAAVDTPEGLVARVAAGQRVYFRAPSTVDEAALAALPGVDSVGHEGGELAVAGRDVLLTVVTELARQGVTPTELRVEHAGLEDAFIALTGATA
ncbi:ABC transporter ATP-binding protein [Catellatospora tritici]|uniref:ABC transporter ATP-binding protein n=1 Tax=Catellatospora tritici TaxID=2851566 RepID=UPI001C2DD5C2|nr:ABC transporter ATP-binding protein [Catellatospora tritici]MBV1849448.1 ABC transporter ATP-binding protein [Catellatospora tritici]MBV1854020.1 ABC transporter ATP-binding protein [Catellatospora tritici]